MADDRHCDQSLLSTCAPGRALAYKLYRATCQVARLTVRVFVGRLYELLMRKTVRYSLRPPHSGDAVAGCAASGSGLSHNEVGGPLAYPRQKASLRYL